VTVGSRIHATILVRGGGGNNEWQIFCPFPTGKWPPMIQYSALLYHRHMDLQLRTRALPWLNGKRQHYGRGGQIDQQRLLY